MATGPRNGKMKASKKAKIIASTRNMPDYVKESIKRQYSGKDYTIEDKKNVINWYKQAKNKTNSVNA